jgi:toxin HigB-1
MIGSFRGKEAQRIFDGFVSRRLPQDIQSIVRRKLRQIDASERLEDLRVPPGNRLEALSGDRDGQYSIRVNQQWRICFNWNQGRAENVEVCDYH